MASHKKETSPEIPVLEIDGRAVPLRIRMNPRARRLIVRVEPIGGDVVVVAPSARSVKAALSFAESQKTWIARRLAEVPSAVPFEAGAEILVRGIRTIIAHRPDARRGVWLDDSGEPQIVGVSGDAGFTSRRVHTFLKREARKDLTSSVRQHTNQLNLPYPKVTLRDTVSRWGSCSSRAGLSFSWRLIMAPPFVLDYVAAHEVAHLEHMNHSAAFWAVVETLVGDVREAHTWLEQNGPNLHRYGRAETLLRPGVQPEDLGNPLEEA